ncbi:DUF2493 domain-containing protein [Novosphingobium sp. YJ-S2-02]|uniref:DUF2493 domain-containing protein n=1 Tax=Novosphingobium aureum TaxID=2792964 RepID=A0A931HD51_9SPHN|nr:DUF2493 domain-containing protein [Novosphingobium aureum]MBH0113234.1 DUF2493 domain-containing protein [Novosphingobium aureum]
MNRRVLVTGGRAFADRVAVFRTLDALQPIECVIHGDATGADALAREWARVRGVPDEAYAADWENLEGVPASRRRINRRTRRYYNVTAGFERNQRMLDHAQPTHVIAFAGGRGTNDMVGRTIRARAAGAAIEFVDMREVSQ